DSTGASRPRDLVELSGGHRATHRAQKPLWSTTSPPARVPSAIQVVRSIVDLIALMLPSAMAALTNPEWYDEAGLSMNHQSRLALPTQQFRLGGCSVLNHPRQS